MVAKYGLEVVTPPAAEPVTLDQAKLYVRQDGAADDELITSLIAGARGRCDRVSGRQLATATYRLTIDGFYTRGERSLTHPIWIEFERLGLSGDTRALRLPFPPLQSVDEIVYVDPSGDEQTLAASVYRVVTSQEPGIVVPALNRAWPASAALPDAVQVKFSCGYGAAEDVPADIKQALLRCVAHEYEFREKADEAWMDKLFEAFWYGVY